MKFKNITAIKNEIVEIVDGNQDIRRYMTYLTDTPLSKKGKMADGRLINQIDVEDTLINKTIIPYMYYEEVLEEAKPIMFIHTYKGEMGNMTIGVNKIAIDILCPTKANLMGHGEERCMIIADTITDILDDKKLKSGGMSSLMFTEYEHYRVSKDAEYVALTLVGEIKTSNVRR